MKSPRRKSRKPKTRAKKSVSKRSRSVKKKPRRNKKRSRRSRRSKKRSRRSRKSKKLSGKSKKRSKRRVSLRMTQEQLVSQGTDTLIALSRAAQNNPAAREVLWKALGIIYPPFVPMGAVPIVGPIIKSVIIQACVTQGEVYIKRLPVIYNQLNELYGLKRLENTNTIQKFSIFADMAVIYKNNMTKTMTILQNAMSV